MIFDRLRAFLVPTYRSCKHCRRRCPAHQQPSVSEAVDKRTTELRILHVQSSGPVRRRIKYLVLSSIDKRPFEAYADPMQRIVYGGLPFVT